MLRFAVVRTLIRCAPNNYSNEASLNLTAKVQNNNPKSKCERALEAGISIVFITNCIIGDYKSKYFLAQKHCGQNDFVTL